MIAEPEMIDAPIELTEAAEAEMPMAETADESDGEELLLDSIDMAAEEEISEPEAIEPAAAGTRSWLTQDETSAEPEAKAGGTLFERMSNIARGAAKAQVEESEDEEAPRMRTGTRDPLDIPRFLNRQNNQYLGVIPARPDLD